MVYNPETEKELFWGFDTAKQLVGYYKCAFLAEDAPEDCPDTILPMTPNDFMTMTIHLHQKGLNGCDLIITTDNSVVLRPYKNAPNYEEDWNRAIYYNCETKEWLYDHNGKKVQKYM